MTKTIQKNRLIPLWIQKKQSRDTAAWAGLYGILREKRAINPVQWQRKIRKEWERKLP